MPNADSGVQAANAGSSGANGAGLPVKRGPKAAHKLTGELLQYLREQAAIEPGVKAEELAWRVCQRHAVTLHPRTIQKALKAKAKKGRPI